MAHGLLLLDAVQAAASDGDDARGTAPSSSLQDNDIMHLTPWRGNASLYLLQNEVNRLFDGFGSDTEGFAPALDVKEDDKQLTISAELPGVDRNNIEISVRGDVLEIKGHKQEERTEKTDHTYIHERSYGAFTRSLRLPVEVDSDRAEAKMKNGVLELSLPKARGGGHAKTISIN